MKNSIILLVMLVLCLAGSSVTAANITWSVTASPTNGGKIAVLVGGQGAVNPAKIAVSPETATTIEIRSVVPKAGYYLDSVKKDGKVADKFNPVFTSDKKSHKVILYFKKCPVITASAVSVVGGTITPSGKVPVEYGSDMSFTVASADGYSVKVLRVDGKAVPFTGNPYTFVGVMKAHTIGVTFAVKSYSVTSQVIGGNGILTSVGTKTVSHGKSLVYTAHPDKGCIPAIYVNGDLKARGTVDNPLTYRYENIAADSTVEAKFSEPVAQLDIADYLPQNAGDTYSYDFSDSLGYTICQSETIGETTTFHGNAVTPFDCTRQMDDWTEYRLLNGDGYYLYGWFDPDEDTDEPGDGSEYYADPPSRILPRNITVGETYTSTSNTVKSYATVAAEECVTVAAGTFTDVLKVIVTFSGPDAPLGWTWWLARDVGNIREECYADDGSPILLELRSATINGQSYGEQGPPPPPSF